MLDRSPKLCSSTSQHGAPKKNRSRINAAEQPSHCAPKISWLQTLMPVRPVDHHVGLRVTNQLLACAAYIAQELRLSTSPGPTRAPFEIIQVAAPTLQLL